MKALPPNSRIRLLEELSAGVIAVSLALALEVTGVALIHHAHLTGPWELRAALAWLLPIAVVAALPMVLLAVGVGALLDDGRRTTRIAVALIALTAAGALGWGITFGRHFQQLPLRLGFVAALACGAAALAWFASPPIASLRRRFPGVVAGACAVAAIAVEVANQLVLPRLYPAFHVALSVIALGLAIWAGRPLTHALPRRALFASSLVLVLIASAVSPLAVRTLPTWDNLRLLYVNQAPTLAHAVRLAAALQPRQDVQADLSATPEADSTRWLDWRDRDVLLVSVDAMRADHMSAYGYDRKTTPNIDALAERGVLFERAYTVMPHTSYAMTSLLTGKYMRPLLMQGTGQDSDTLAGILRTYGYRTAAFHPPSIFAVDEDKFGWAKESGLDFEYRKQEYADAPLRLRQALDYLQSAPESQRLFLWAHYFDPHEPYAPPAEFEFGPRAIDRYDGEIASADAAVGKLVEAMLEKRPAAVIIITADHGEAFGDHGAYHHGTTVYEEQVRVPLIILAQGLEPRRVPVPVQLIDITPTLLKAMHMPRRPRLRGVDLGDWLTGRGEGEGFAFSETHDQVLLAEGPWRLVCERKIDACSLFDLTTDPGQLKDASAREPERFQRMRTRMRTVEASHGTYERAGSRAEGKTLPPQLVRGLAGDGDAAVEVAGLLDDADVVLRRKAGEVLFRLARAETSAALSLAVSRDEDGEVRNWCALALTRLGHGAPLTIELAQHEDIRWRRLASLVLAETGDARGEATLLAWWSEQDVPVAQRKEIAKALAKIKARNAVVPLTKWLGNEQLRPTLAVALAEIGDPYGKIPLLRFFSEERYMHTRVVMAQALLDLGASREMAPALARFLGMPDPLEGGLAVGRKAKVLDALGGPDEKGLSRLQASGPEGADFRVVVPKGGNGTGCRVLLRVRATGTEVGKVRFGLASRVAGMARLDPKATVSMDVKPSSEWQEIHGALPEAFGASPGRPLHVVVVPGRQVEVEAFAVVGLADEIPPPAPEPWSPGDSEGR